jgi:HlyD family secretion protein
VQAASLTKGDPKEELQGVFVLKNKKEAVFVPVTTGISGTTDIEVSSGLKDGDEIVTGSYKVLRTLRNGANVKVDNTTGTKKEES